MLSTISTKHPNRVLVQWGKYDPILARLILNLHLAQLSVVSAKEDEMIKASTNPDLSNRTVRQSNPIEHQSFDCRTQSNIIELIIKFCQSNTIERSITERLVIEPNRTFERIANIFNDFFVNIANHIEAPSEEVYGRDFVDHPSVMASSGSVSSSFSFSPTNSTCVKQLLLDINIRKSPGYDNITPRLFKLSAECVAEPLCAIFNAAIDQSMYPAAWKKGQITPIPKGSDSEIDKTLFRPVTVLPAMNNIFEKILASQLTSYFQGVLSDFLSAYRKHHSCHTTLLRLVEDWKKSLDDGKLVAIVAMDLSKAFDSLPHSLLISKLQAYGLDNSSCAFLQNYLTGRFQRVKVGDEVSCWELNRRGVPQGSVLGPLCFNVFLNDLSFFILRVSLNAYADDQQLYGADSDHEALYARPRVKGGITVVQDEWPDG